MANTYFQFKQFTVQQDRCAMKVTTDACLFGAWAGERVGSLACRQAGSESGVKSSESGIVSLACRQAGILDIGAGTGLLTLMIAQKIDATIDTVEIDKDAFEQAKENINSTLWKERINIFHADAGKFIFPSQYDVIISNPPFYENELKSDDAKKNLAHHGGLTLKEFFGIIKKNLSPGGKFYCLLPYKRDREIERSIMVNDLNIEQKTLVRQSSNHDYFRIMISGVHKNNEEEIIIDEICIQGDQQQYSGEFTRLLKDYYLYL